MGSINLDKKKKLIILLVGLCLLIIVLAVVVVAFVTNNGETDNYQEIGDEMVNCGALDRLEDDSQVVNCIGRMYDEKGEKETIALFDEYIQKSYDAKDYDLFSALLLGKGSFSHITLHKNCTYIIKKLDDSRISELSPDGQFNYYQEAAGIVSDCPDSSGVELFEGKKEQVRNEHQEEFKKGAIINE